MKLINSTVIFLFLAIFLIHCNTNIFDPFSRDGAPVPFISTAESLTEEGDAHLANGDLDAALISYDEALKKDAHYQPAIVGRVAVRLQIMVKNEFPGKETFTSAVIPLIYDSIEALGDTDSGELTYATLMAVEDIVTIQQKYNVFKEVDWGYNELAFKIDNPSTSVLINMTILLAYDAINRLAALLQTVESLQTLANQFETQPSGITKFEDDVTSFEIVVADLVIVDMNGIDASGLQDKMLEWRDTYQRLYYVYYFFQNDFVNVEGQIQQLDALLTPFVAKVSASDNEIIAEIVPRIEKIQQEIQAITSQLDRAAEYKVQFETQVAPRIRDLENELDSLDQGIKNASGYSNFDISLCGLSLDNGGNIITGAIGQTQLDATSVELNSPPVISDDPDHPCSGNNARFTGSQ